MSTNRSFDDLIDRAVGNKQRLAASEARITVLVKALRRLLAHRGLDPKAMASATEQASVREARALVAECEG